MATEVEPHSKPEPIFIGHVTETDAESQNQSPIAPQQRITAINLKYNPEVNLRNYSYLVFTLGFLFSVILIMDFDFNSIKFGSSLCCFSFALAAFIDASYLKGKSEWQESMGQSNSSTNLEVAFSVVVGIISIMIALKILSFS